jgi:IclR family transcriptional regulator, acetate operon repressor
MKTGNSVQSVRRAATLLMLAAQMPDGITATECAARIGAAVPTTHHLLSTLEQERLLTKTDRRRFVLGPRAGVIAEAFLRTSGAPAALHGSLVGLAGATGETAYLLAWRDHEIRVLDSLEGANAVRVAEIARGPYHDPHARAAGKLLLALADEETRDRFLDPEPPALTPHTITDRAELDREFERIRTQGYAEDVNQFIEGVSCFAAPIIVDGVTIAALAVLAPSRRFQERRERLLDAILRAAALAAEDQADDLHVATG